MNQIRPSNARVFRGVQLTEAERETLAEWLAKRREASQKSQEAYTAMSADRWLVTLAKAIREGQELRPEQAAAIWHGMGEVGKALRKAGHAKPKAVRKGKPVDPADPKDQGEGAPKGK